MMPRGDRKPTEASKRRVRPAPALSGAEPASGTQPKIAAVTAGVITAPVAGFAVFVLVMMLGSSEADMLYGDVVTFVVAVAASMITSLVAGPIAAVVAYVVTRRRNDRRRFGDEAR